MKIQPIILAGGTGSRLWPLSRELYPKQLLDLVGDRSLLQTTLERVSSLPNILPPLLVIGNEHRFITKAQVEELNLFASYHIILEPIDRNTGPAICGAALYARQHVRNDTILLVLPADHLITHQGAFIDAVKKATELAAEGNITTFGIVPDRPETGYGYISQGDGNKVASFVEKPDMETAKQYLASGQYLWNSGMFAFKTETFLAEIELHAPDILNCMKEAVDHGKEDNSFFHFPLSAMKKCPDISIDYSLMEKTSLAVVVKADIGWSDIGSWEAYWEVSDKDDNGNVTRGDVMLEDVTNSFIHSEDMLVTAIGLTDTMVVETGDALLVAPLSKSQDVKKIVTRLKKDNRAHYHVHRTVYRPWGSHTTLEMQPRFQIKRISVNPRAKLSLQMHHHRHEHWVVVSGTARITNGKKSFLLHEDQSAYIPAGTQHRLENPGVIPLELIEVQIGSYLGEDDIVRFDDEYGSNKE